MAARELSGYFAFGPHVSYGRVHLVGLFETGPGRAPGMGAFADRRVKKKETRKHGNRLPVADRFCFN